MLSTGHEQDAQETKRPIIARHTRPDPRIDLRGPVIALILAATAVPVELKPPGAIGFTFQPVDFLLNIAGYVPVGFVLGLPAARTLLIAAMMSLLAESVQCVMMLRDPSIMDVVANTLGAAAGLAAAARWKLPPLVPLRRWMGGSAAVLAAALVAAVAAMAGPGVSPAGSTAAGALEAFWKFDEPDGKAVLDSSPHGLRGVLHGGAARVPGVHGGAIALYGVDDYIDMGATTAFRLVGSLTVSAWVKAVVNPVDDAAIVSTLHHDGPHADDYGTGFQLDTTVDSGPRAIGFKLTDTCGSLFARYGATPLLLDTWYYVTGVYDAQARTIDVYLNGQQDNGLLVGTVPGARRSSREPLSVGRRGDSHGFEFSGLVDDVRVYSRALVRDEVVADMTDEAMTAPARPAGGTRPDHGEQGPRPVPASGCAWTAEPEEARLPVTVAALGMLIALATIGLVGLRGSMPGVALATAGGFLLFRVATPTLPSFNAWAFPLTSMAAAACVIASMRRRETGNNHE